MSDIVLDDIGSGYNLSKVNSNFNKIKEAINESVLHRVGGNNILQQDIDMNSNRIYNLPKPESLTEPVRLGDLTGGEGIEVNVSGNSLSPSSFGASAESDSHAEIQACFDEAASKGYSVYLEDNAVYRSDDSIDTKGVTVWGKGEINWSNATSLSLGACMYDSGSLVNLGQPIADIVKGYAQFTLATTLTEPLEPGDALFIGSEEQFTYCRRYYKKGEG